MAMSKKKSSTPALLPWIPPGKPSKEETFNYYANKKNSKLELDLGKSLGADDAKKHSFMGKKKSREEKKYLDDSHGSEDRRELRDKIMDIFEEDEEDERRRSRSRNKRSKSEERRRKSRSRSRSKRRSRSEDRERRRRKSRSRSRERRRRKSKDEGFEDDEKHRRRHRKHRSKAQKGNRRSSEDTSGIASLVEDIEDRRSIEFIDNIDTHHPQVVPITQHPSYRHQFVESDQYPYQQPQQQQPMMQQRIDSNQFRHHPNYQDHNQFSSLPPNMRLVDPHQPQQDFHLGHHSDYSYPQSQSPFGMGSVHLSNNNSHNQNVREAWLVFPKDKRQNANAMVRQGRQSLRSFTAKPVNLAASFGSQLKNSFNNIHRIRETPVESFNLIDETPEEKAEKRKKRRKSAYYSAAITASLCLLFLAITLGAVIASTNSNDSEALVTANSTGGTQTGACAAYTSLRDSWRRIRSSSVSFPSNELNCDLPRSNGNGLRPGWYRFQGDAGTHLPTAAPGFNVCGTNIVAWLNGKHPKVHEGETRSTICFQWNTGECQHSVETRLRTCDDPDTGGTYYLYYLDYPTDISCNYAFCANGN